MTTTETLNGRIMAYWSKHDEPVAVEVAEHIMADPDVDHTEALAIVLPLYVRNYLSSLRRPTVRSLPVMQSNGTLKFRRKTAADFPVHTRERGVYLSLLKCTVDDLEHAVAELRAHVVGYSTRIEFYESLITGLRVHGKTRVGELDSSYYEEVVS